MLQSFHRKRKEPQAMNYEEFKKIYKELDNDVKIALWLTLIESRQQSALPESPSDTYHKAV